MSLPIIYNYCFSKNMILRRKIYIKIGIKSKYNTTKYININEIIFGRISYFSIDSARYAISYILKELYHGRAESLRIGRMYMISGRHNGLSANKYRLNEIINVL